MILRTSGILDELNRSPGSPTDDESVPTFHETSADMHCSSGRCGSPILDGGWALLAGQKRIPSEASRIHALNPGLD